MLPLYQPNTMGTNETGVNDIDLEAIASVKYVCKDKQQREFQPNMRMGAKDRDKQINKYGNEKRMFLSLLVTSGSYLVLKSGFNRSPATSAMVSGLLGVGFFTYATQNKMIMWNIFSS